MCRWMSFRGLWLNNSKCGYTPSPCSADLEEQFSLQNWQILCLLQPMCNHNGVVIHSSSSVAPWRIHNPVRCYLTYKVKLKVRGLRRCHMWSALYGIAAQWTLLFTSPCIQCPSITTWLLASSIFFEASQIHLPYSKFCYLKHDGERSWSFIYLHISDFKKHSRYLNGCINLMMPHEMVHIVKACSCCAFSVH
jgi:hypothetical protein